ncbi:MAG: tetratricopeptide repeat protein, partial [Kiritimatiellae bacterium]|nr:tetratricopeptide repeat protein [Kiritimatiellia bacterium]
MPKIPSFPRFLSVAVPAAAAARLGAPSACAADARAGSDPALELELRYVQALNDNGMAEYADLVIKDAQARWPDAKVRLKTVALEQVLALGRFDEAEKIIRAEKDQDAPETWAMRMLSAAYRFTRGQYDEALGVYAAFFKKYGANPPSALDDTYVNGAYQYQQMLQTLHRDKEAVAVFEKMLAFPRLPKSMERQPRFEYAELLVKLAEESKDAKERASMLEKAEKSIEELFWEQDIWFGRAVALMAHVKAARGKPDEARELVEGYMEPLLSIDSQLEEQGKAEGVDYSALSPIAECRYLLGGIAADQADAIVAGAKGAALSEDAENKAVGLYAQALRELVNVYVQYPSFKWAVEAMDRVEAIEKTLDGLGYDVESTITPEQRALVAHKQFENALSFYNQGYYDKAVSAYESVLRNYPLVVPDSVQGLGILAKAALERSEAENDADEKNWWELYSRTVAGHLSERFAAATRDGVLEAGGTLRSVAQFYSSHQREDLSKETLERFIGDYPDHPDAVSTAFVMGEEARRAEDWAEAARIYRIVAERYGDSRSAMDALNRLGDCWNKLGKPDLEIEAREAYLEKVSKLEKPGAEFPAAKAKLARSRRARDMAALKAATTAWDEIRRGVAPAA